QSISHSKIYPESLTYAVRYAIELIEKLKNAPQKTQNYVQKTQQNDQYYALPLFAFISGEVMKDYFQANIKEPEDQRFKDILSIYIRSLYPVGNVLPIGYQYQEFPFVVFRSYSLEEIRNKVFTEKYLLNSHELNILNLILSL
ncbi:MAG: helicase, partial [Dolichospermum sp.]